MVVWSSEVYRPFIFIFYFIECSVRFIYEYSIKIMLLEKIFFPKIIA